MRERKATAVATRPVATGRGGETQAGARLFIALWPGEAVRRRLVACADAAVWPPRAARVKPQKLHLTLHFIGAVPRRRLPELRHALTVESKGFELVLDSAGVWRSGVAVIEAREAPPALSALHAALAERLRGLGLSVEKRPFRAHVTLARHALGAKVDPPAAPLRWRVLGYRLVESTPDGLYVMLARYGSRAPRPR